MDRLQHHIACRICNALYTHPNIVSLPYSMPIYVVFSHIPGSFVKLLSSSFCCQPRNSTLQLQHVLYLITYEQLDLLSNAIRLITLGFGYSYIVPCSSLPLLSLCTVTCESGAVLCLRNECVVHMDTS